MRARPLTAIGAGLALAALASCRSTPPPASSAPARSCSVVIWHHPESASAHVELVGDWSGWSRPGQVFNATSYPGWLATSVTLAPGEHLYSIVEDGTWLTDPNVPTTGYHAGQEVTWIDVADCATPGLRVDAVAASPDGSATVEATFLAAQTEDPIAPSSVVVTAHDGTTVAPASVEGVPGSGKVTLSFTGLPPGKHTLAIAARDTKGRAADPAWATVWIEPRPWDPQDMVLYQVIVDRYRGDGGAPLQQPAIPSARAGGTLAGLRAAIENGDFAKLGVNALWVSPLYANPDGWFAGADGKPYSSYHGYWPIDARSIESALGSEADVDALVASAHAHDMRVLFDVVPNHVHQQHPYAEQHLNAGWFNHPDGSCICGDPTCDWTTHITDCWFIGYLPDLDWRNPTVADQVTGDVTWWIDRFDADGIRIDAVPMMVRAATRRIVASLRGKYEHPANTMFLLGENFVGQGDFDLLKYQLGPDGLNSEFHFPLMWALRGAVADESQPMSAIDDAVQGGIADWAGSGAVMTTLLGNHDVDRFATESAADGAGDNWTAAVQPPDGSPVYAKQALALGALFALPGAPVVYYGDELAMVGHYDPDSRHVMPAEASLGQSQLATRAALARYAKVRACSSALRRGTYRTLLADAEHLVFAREDGGDTAVVALFRNASSLTASFPGIPAGNWVDALSGQAQSLSPELTNVVGAPLSLQLLFPQGSPCATSAQ
jgi:glycosidase